MKEVILLKPFYAEILTDKVIKYYAKLRSLKIRYIKDCGCYCAYDSESKRYTIQLLLWMPPIGKETFLGKKLNKEAISREDQYLIKALKKFGNYNLFAIRKIPDDLKYTIKRAPLYDKEIERIVEKHRIWTVLDKEEEWV